MASARKTLANVIVDRLKTGKDRPPLARQLAAYLVEEKKTREVDLLMRDVARVRAERDGILEVNVTSAFPLTPQIRERIKRLWPARQVIMNEIIDKSVVGNVRLETPDRQIDLTLEHQLQDLRHALPGRNA